MSNKRIDIQGIEARMRLWREGDISDEDLALELDYIVPELKRCYEEIDKLRNKPVSISCEHCSNVYDEEYLHEMLEIGPNGECVMCLEEASE